MLVALADAGRRLPIPLEAFGELIDGCEADVRGTSYDTLTSCGTTAAASRAPSGGSAGRVRHPGCGHGRPLADALGVALQLTNILRDIREDYREGRVYLPAEDFNRFGSALRQRVRLARGDPKLVTLVRFEAERARDWYARGLG